MKFVYWNFDRKMFFGKANLFYKINQNFARLFSTKTLLQSNVIAIDLLNCKLEVEYIKLLTLWSIIWPLEMISWPKRQLVLLFHKKTTKLMLNFMHFQDKMSDLFFLQKMVLRSKRINIVHFRRIISSLKFSKYIKILIKLCMWINVFLISKIIKSNFMKTISKQRWIF